MKINTILLTLLLFLSPLAEAQHTTGESLKEDFATLLAEKSRNMESILCTFTETRHMSIFTQDVVRKGVFRYKRAEGMVLDFENGDRILMTRDLFSIRTDGRTTTSRMTANPMLRQMKNIFSACMSGDAEALCKSGEMRIEKSRSGYRVHLVPVARSARKYVSDIILDFDRTDMTLIRLHMEQPSGDYTRYEFHDKRFNTNLDAKFFQAN